MATAGTSEPVRNGVLLLGLAACMATSLAFAIGERWVTDDALIVFRYVDNLLVGEGLVYNPGEHLESFSSPLWVLLLALLGLLGADPWPAAQVLGGICTAIELSMIVALLRRHGPLPLPAIAAGLLFATDRVVYVWATGGLETSLYSALVFAGFWCTVDQCRRPIGARSIARASIVHLLVATARPEGIVLYGPYLLVVAVLGRRRGAGLRPAGRSLTIVGSGLLALLMLRYAYYGALLPHTYQAKLSGVPVGEFGRGYLWAFAERQGLVGPHAAAWALLLGIFVVSVLFARRGERAPEQVAEQRDLLRIAGLGGLYVLLGSTVVGFVGGDYMTDFRFMRPLMGILFVTAAALFGHAFATRGLRVVPLAGLAAMVALQWSHHQRQVTPTPIFADAPDPFEHKLNNQATEQRATEFRAALYMFTEPGDALLTDVSGIKGYGHRLRTVDATGLTSALIEGNFYLRPQWATPNYRDRLPGHARWPKLDFLSAEGFALITPKLSDDGHDVAEVTARSHRRYRRYPFLHVTMAVGGDRFLRFFTTLSADELNDRAQARGLDLCWRAPLADRAVCAGMNVTPPPEVYDRPAKPPGIEAQDPAPARTPQQAAQQYFGAMQAADCEWLRATTAGPQAQRDAYLTCPQLTEQLQHMAPIRLWAIEWERPARTASERLLQVRFFLEGRERTKIMRVEQLDGQWRVTRL